MSNYFPIDTTGPKNQPEIKDENGGIVATLDDLKEKGEKVMDHAASGDWGSILLEVLSWVGIDVRAWIREKLFGNFDDMSKAAGSYGVVGDHLRELSGDVRQGIPPMKGIWQGESANVAQGQLLLYSAGLDVSGKLFSEGGELLQMVVGALKSMADKVMALIEKLIDWLVNKIISALSGIAGAIKAAFEAKGWISDAKKMWDDAVTVYNTIKDKVSKVKEFYDKIKDAVTQVKDLYDGLMTDVESIKSMAKTWQGNYEYAKSYVEAVVA